MEVEKDVDSILKNALLIVNKDETLLRYILNNLYYYFFLNFFVFYYYNFYNVSNSIVKCEQNIRLLHKNNNNILLIHDNGIKLFNFFFPYETIIEFGVYGKRVLLTVYANIEFNHKSIIFLKKEHISKVFISFQTKYPESVIYTIKKNMYYHFKYNQINKSLLKKIM